MQPTMVKWYCSRNGIFLPSASVYGNNVLKILFIWNILAITPRRHLVKNPLLFRPQHHLTISASIYEDICTGQICSLKRHFDF
jgi:hypothetical protein